MRLATYLLWTLLQPLLLAFTANIRAKRGHHHSSIMPAFALLKLALDNPNSHHTHISEQYKYQVLLSHLKFASAQQLAKAYMHHPQPYTAALQALQKKYGQPRQLVQSELSTIMSAPPLRMGDISAFDSFTLSL